MLQLADVEAAAERIAGRVVRTPALISDAISRATGAEVVRTRLAQQPRAHPGTQPQDRDRAQGGAGMGSRITTVAIASDAPPAGMFAIEYGDQEVGEGGAVAQFYVSRSYSYSGEVSVNVTVACC